MPFNPMTFAETYISREKGRIYTRDYAGAGPAFVLMHGFPDNLHIYDQLIPYLVAAGRRVVTFDFLGYGASDKPAGTNYSFRQQLGDLEAVLDALHLEKIVPVGHDAGGPAAINFTLDHPDRVSFLCTLNTFYAASPTLQLPELIALFAIPGLKALTGAMLQSPEQLAWVFRFQQLKFLETLPEKQRQSSSQCALRSSTTAQLRGSCRFRPRLCADDGASLRGGRSEHRAPSRARST